MVANKRGGEKVWGLGMETGGVLPREKIPECEKFLTTSVDTETVTRSTTVASAWSSSAFDLLGD